MKVAAATIKKAAPGTCPHGLPYGACPICSGSGGGGGSVSKSKPRVAGEMSWDQCYSVWQQMLKAKDAAHQKKLDAIHAQIQAQAANTSKLENFALKIANLAEKIADFTQKNTNLPKIIEKPLNFALKMAIPILNVISNIANIAQKALNFVQQKLADISDKLNAIFGELKNSTEKKISENLKNAKKKLKTIFGLLEPEELSEEEKEAQRRIKAEELEKLFKLDIEKEIANAT